MRRLLSTAPIERQVKLITMLTTTLALLFASGAFMLYERAAFRLNLVERLQVLATVLGDNSSAALSFGDRDAAEQTLRALAAESGIQGAALYGPDGQLFATYRKSGLSTPFIAPQPEIDGHRFEADRFRLFRGIELAGEHAGSIYLESSLGELEALMWRYASVVLPVSIAIFLFAFLLITRLQKVITGPVSDLARVVGVVAARKDYSVRAVKRGDNELGRLIDGFNGMLEQIELRDGALNEASSLLEQRVQERTRELQVRTQELQKEIAEREQAERELAETHKQLVEASRRGGMAEIATNVLHNVGNVLTSVNVSATLVAERLQGARIDGLRRAVDLMAEHRRDLPSFFASGGRGEQLPDYLEKLTDRLEEDCKATRTEVESLRANIEHIKEIVAMQQSYAKVSAVREKVEIVDLVEDSLRLNSGALTRHGVELSREFQPVPPVVVDKHKVLQILVNLVRNAKYACDESGRPDKRLVLRIDNGDGKVKISVSDNGVGIPPENLTRIFQHGFTTRERGHGFGLHSGALAAREIGGQLSVRSDGIGKGATFVLELPVQPPEASP